MAVTGERRKRETGWGRNTEENGGPGRGKERKIKRWMYSFGRGH